MVSPRTPRRACSSPRTTIARTSTGKVEEDRRRRGGQRLRCRSRTDRGRSPTISQPAAPRRAAAADSVPRESTGPEQRPIVAPRAAEASSRAAARCGARPAPRRRHATRPTGARASGRASRGSDDRRSRAAAAPAWRQRRSTPDSVQTTRDRAHRGTPRRRRAGRGAERAARRAAIASPSRGPQRRPTPRPIAHEPRPRRRGTACASLPRHHDGSPRARSAFAVEPLEPVRRSSSRRCTPAARRRRTPARTRRRR